MQQQLQRQQQQQQHWAGPLEIGAHEVEKTKTLGKGSFGVVYAGKCRAQDVAIKVLFKQDFDPKALAAFKREIEIMRFVRSFVRSFFLSPSSSLSLSSL